MTSGTFRNLVFGAVAIWLLAWMLIVAFIKKTDRGQFGDMFGAVNSLFSALTMAGAIYAVLLQTKEIEAQRKEQKANEDFRDLQMKAMLRMVEGTQEQVAIARSRELPIFNWGGYAARVNVGNLRREYNYTNKGGTFKVKEIRVLNNTQVTATNFHSGYIQNGMKSIVIFQGPMDAIQSLTVRFEIHFKGVLEDGFMVFKILNGGPPVPDEEGDS